MLDKKAFGICWASTIAPIFTVHGITWKRRDAKFGKLVREDGLNVLVLMTVTGKINPFMGGDFVVGIAISRHEEFIERVAGIPCNLRSGG